MLSSQPNVMASHLPAAVASFHSAVDMPGAGCLCGQSSASQLNGMDSGSGSGASSQTGDALGKALASVSGGVCLSSFLLQMA